MTCAICGATLNPGAMFCGECGSKVTAVSVVPAQPEQFIPAQVPSTAHVSARAAVIEPSMPLQDAMAPAPAAAPAAAPEVAAESDVAPAPASAPVVVAAPAPAPVVAPAPAVFEPLNDDFDETVISPRAPVLTITGPDGIPHVIRAATVIGRAPQRPADRPTVEVLALADLSKSLSKSHAIVTPEGEQLLIEDVGSTNGVIIKHSDGRETVLPAHRAFPLAVGTVLELGDYVLTVGHR